MHALWSRMVCTMSNGYTGSRASISAIAVSIRINTPVRPMPAEQWTIIGGFAELMHLE